MSRRLMNRSGVLAGRQPSSGSTEAAELPEYEPPACPLNEDARKALGDLTKDRKTDTYQSQLKTSLRFFGTSVGDLHERLREEQQRLEEMARRRTEKHREKTDDEERLERHVEDLEDKVAALTEKSEQAVRELIDKQAELEDEGVILHDLYTTAASHAARRIHHNAEADGEAATEESPASTLQAFESQRAVKLAAYTSMTAHERYAINNEYIAFKKLWHDAMAGEDGAPLPDASRWFRADGRPVLNPGGGDDADDDDIAVSREVVSTRCPLTMVEFDQPYTCRNCKHTFEKSAILDFLGHGGDKQCPQTGCSQTMSRARFEEDFYYDQAMVRRVKRTKQRDLQDEDEDEDEDGEGDSELMVRGQRGIPNRTTKQESE